jgi:PAS domain S-box-containing protein
MRSAHQQLFDNAPVALVTVDAAGVVTDCNHAAVRFLARNRDEVVGRPILQWIVTTEREQARAEFVRGIGGKTSEWSTRVVRGDGIIRHTTVRCIVQRGQASDTLQLDVSLTDTHTQRSTRSEPRQLIDLLLGLPGHCALAVDLHGKIRYSAGAARTHWQNDDDVLGRHFTTLLHPNEAARDSVAAMLEAAGRGEAWSGIQVHARPDGSTIVMRVFAAPLKDTDANAARGAVLVCRDVSHEEELRARTEANRRLATVGKVVTSVAQELLNGMDEGGPGAIARTRGLLNQLLQFASDSPLAREPQSVRVVAMEVISEINASFIRNDVPAELPLLMTDHTHLRIMLWQLLENACQAASVSDGPYVSVGAEATPSHIRIRLDNNGAALPQDAGNRVYEPFYTTRPNHFGLGLPIVRSLAELYGGRVWHETGVERTTFVLELPLHTGDDGPRFRAGRLKLARNRTVLVVDDDAATRAVVRKILEKVGYSVDEAWSGRSALAHIAAYRQPNVMLADLKMTGGTGYWLLNELRRDMPEMLKRTIIVTGQSASTALEELSKLSGCPVLRKPIDFPLLLEVMDDVVASTTQQK